MSDHLMRIVTHDKPGQYLKLSELCNGGFLLITQNGPQASSFEFSADTPEYVKESLRDLQIALERANQEGIGGGVSNTMPRAALRQA